MADEQTVPTHVPKGKEPGGYWIWYERQGKSGHWIYKRAMKGKRRSPKGFNHDLSPTARLVTLEEAKETYDTLDERSRKYIERRLRGLPPASAMKDLLLDEGNDRVSGAQCNGLAAAMEVRVKPLLEQMQQGEGMTDTAFEAWTERMVRGMAEDSQTGARLTAIKWLMDRREEKKYADEESLRETIANCERRMKELEVIMAEGVTGSGAPGGLEA